MLTHGFGKCERVGTLEISRIVWTPGALLTALLQFGKLHWNCREDSGVWGQEEEIESAPVGSRDLLWVHQVIPLLRLPPEVWSLQPVRS